MRYLSIALALAALPSWGQIRRAELPELERSLSEDLNYLASDELGGRLPGTEQGDRAAKYIQARFEELALSGLFNGEYLQSVEIPVRGLLPEGGNQLNTGGVALELRTHYWPHVLSDNRSVEGKMMWLGYGTPNELKKAKKGVVAVLIATVPEKMAKKLGKAASLTERIRAARALGAQGIILLQPVNGKPTLDLLRRMRPVGMPIVTVHDLAAAKTLKKQAKKSANATLQVQVIPETTKAPNVGAWMNRGAPETLIVGAHYDHVGWGEWGSRTPELAGQVHNGADDNASGTSAVLALAKVRQDAPFDKICYIGCGVTTGIGAVINTAKVKPGDNVVVFGLGGIGLNVVQGARMVGANMIVGVDLNNERKEMAEKFGMTHFVNPGEVEGDLVPYLVDLTKGGADHSFECIGNVNVMRDALECCHKGWGESVIIGVAGAGQEIKTRPFQLVTGRSWRGTAFGGARGRTDVPKIVDWYMQGKIEIDPMITHKLSLDDINKGFDLMHEGKSIRAVVEY